MQEKLAIYIGCMIILLGGLSASYYIEYSKEPLVVRQEEELQVSNTKEFFEMFSLGSADAFVAMKSKMGNNAYLGYSGALTKVKGDVPLPLIYKYDTDGRSAEILFSTSVGVDPEIYRYKIRYGSNGKLERINSEYVYGGGNNE